MTNDSKDKKDQTEPTEDQHDAYLQDQHEVSATYHVLGDEKPSAELDERILNAAREELAEAKSAGLNKPYGFAIFKRWPANYYPIAASVLLVMVVTSLYLGSSPRQQIEAMKAEINPNAAQQLSTTAASQDSTTVTAGDENAAPQRQRAEAPQLQLLPPVQALELESIDENVFVDNDGQLEEVIVTGSRITISDSVNSFTATNVFESSSTQYRNSVDDWLEEILFLSVEDIEAAEIERALFIDAYPEIDLDQALSELLEEN